MVGGRMGRRINGGDRWVPSLLLVGMGNAVYVFVSCT